MAQRIYFPNLNGLRFIAAAIVVASHVEELCTLFGLADHSDRRWLSLEQISLSGELAVTLFFALSGYLITYLLLVERQRIGSISLPKFYWRRILRILPLYFFLVTIGLFLVPQFEGMDYPIWSEELVNGFWTKTGLLYVMLPNVLAVTAYPIPHLSHLWSIGVEEQFYLLWPLLMWRFHKTPKLILAVVFLYLLSAKPLAYLLDAGILEGVWLTRLSNFMNLTRIDCMALGGLAAWWLFAKGKEYVASKISNPIRWLSILAAVSFMLTIPQFGLWTHEVYALLFCALLLVVSVCPPKGFSLEHPWLSYLGRISYGIYMFHFIAIRLAIFFVQSFQDQLAGLSDGYNVVLVYLLSFFLTIVFSALSFRLLETPFLKLKSRYTVVNSNNIKQ